MLRSVLHRAAVATTRRAGVAPSSFSSLSTHGRRQVQRMQQWQQQNRHYTEGEIPIVDMADFFNGTEADQQRIAQELDTICTEIGFLAVTGHGVDQNVIDTAWKTTQEYFDLPVEEKMKITMTDDYPYGYDGYESESLSRGYGQTSLPDLNESFAIGPVDPAAGLAAPQFPPQPPLFERAWRDYFSAMSSLAQRMLRAFAMALRLEPTFFDGKIDRHRSALRSLNYPELNEDPKPGQVRAGVHTDYGTITILNQDDTGGLQVLGKRHDDDWIDVPCVPGAFVINLGDCMQRWTNDRWVSTRHRVVTHDTKARRQSMAFFHNLNGDQVVECIPTCTSADNPVKYPPIGAWDLLMQKHSAAVATDTDVKK